MVQKKVFAIGLMLVVVGLAAIGREASVGSSLRVLPDSGANVSGSAEFVCMQFSVTATCATEAPACTDPGPPPGQCTACDGGSTTVGRCRGRSGSCNLTGPSNVSCGFQALGICLTDWPATGYTRCQPSLTTPNGCSTTTESRCN